MTTELRETGISIVGDMPWGSHFCHFYETRDDLLAILIPYFRTGLENNEFCVWIVFDPLDEKQARDALLRAIPEAEQHLAAGAIEIIPHTQWYLREGTFDLRWVINGWKEKLAWAVNKGYVGMRVNGNEAWLTEKDWENFAEYEKKLNELISNERMIVLCTYPLATTSASEFLDVARTHQFAIVKRRGNWEVLKTPELIQAKGEIKRQNEELEQRIADRNNELTSINEKLRLEIFEREIAVEALRKSEERFRSYFDLGLIGIAITSPTTDWIEVNDHLCKILGYDRSELMQLTWTELTHPDDLSTDGTYFNRVLAGEIDGYEIDKRFIRRDGQIIYAAISVKCVRRSDGSVDHFVALLQDITERKKAADEIRKRKNQYDKLVSKITIGIYILRSTPAEALVLEYVSPRMAEMLNLSVESLLADAQIVFQSIHPDDRDAFVKLNQEGMRQKRPFDWEGRVPIERTVKWLHIMSLPEPMENGDVLWYGIVDDITERKGAEEALRIAEKKFRDLLETVQLVSVLLDREGNITFCNDYLLHLTAWKKEEVLGRNWFDLFIPDKEREGYKKVFASVLNGEKEAGHYENSIMARDRRELLISWNNTVLHDLEDKVAGTASIGIDITRQKHLEAQLRQAQKMEAIGQLAGGVAHDFNNILAVIISIGYLLELQLKGNTAATEYVSEIMNAADKAATLTQSLLAFSRKQQINPQPMDLNAAIQNAERILARTIGEDIQLILQLTEQNTTLNADSSQMTQILINLATNARDAMPKGGALTIRTEHALIDEAFVEMQGYGGIGDYVLMTVTDSGKGMDSATRHRAFEPFFTTKEVGKGTGLGLSMVYGIVEQHGGFIKVYSERGTGTAFKVYLPALEGKAEEKQSNEHFKPEGATETILLVEDDTNLRLAMTKLLERFGYTVIEAVDGNDAITNFIANRDKIQLVLMDVIMPNKGGGDAYQELKIIKPEIKIILMSGYAGDFLSEKLRMEADVHFISKPVLPKHLFEIIKTVLHG